MSQVEIRLYEAGDEERIVSMFNRVFGEPNPGFLYRSVELWRHIYLANPNGYQVFVAEDSAGDLVANYSAIPVRLRVKGHDRWGAQPVDSCVAKEARDQKVFVRIARAFLDTFCVDASPRRNELLYGCPNEQAFPIGTRVVGYSPVHVPMSAMVATVGEGWHDVLAERAAGLCARHADWDELPRLAQLWERHADKVPLGVAKDEAYLAWRYRDWPREPHPEPYRLVVTEADGQLTGALVWREGWLGHPLAPLVDMIGPAADRRILAALVGRVAQTVAERGASRLEAWALPSMPLRESLADLGFSPEPSPFNLCVMIYSDLFDFAWAKDSLVLTMGDADIY